LGLLKADITALAFMASRGMIALARRAGQIFNLFGDRQRIIYFDAEISNGAFNFGAT
jgi:hypothetical protein